MEIIALSKSSAKRKGGGRGEEEGRRRGKKGIGRMRKEEGRRGKEGKRRTSAVQGQGLLYALVKHVPQHTHLNHHI